MNFLKKILCIDSTSSKREVLFAEKTETAESVLSADDILTYKKEGALTHSLLQCVRCLADHSVGQLQTLHLVALCIELRITIILIHLFLM